MSKASIMMEEDLSLSLSSLIEMFPNEAKKIMKKEAREFRDFAKTKAENTVNRITGNYLRGFSAGKTVYSWSDSDYNIRVFNKSPHAHLIELGHELVGHEPNKERIGRVKAYEIINNAMEEWERDFESNVENELMDFIAKELEK